MMAIQDVAWIFPVFRKIAAMVDDINAEIIAPECDQIGLHEQAKALMDYVEQQQNQTSAGEIHFKVAWKNDLTGRLLEMEFKAKISQG